MAKESMKARDVKRARLVEQYAERRAELKEKIRLAAKEGEVDYESMEALAKLPRNSNPIRMRNRCQLTGRPRGYMRQFGISRIQFREMASNGLIPGVKKSSWQSKTTRRNSLTRISRNKNPSLVGSGLMRNVFQQWGTQVVTDI